MILDWHTLVGILSSVILILLIVPYIRSTLDSTTKPSAVSWFGWMLLFIIDTVTQASKGIDWSLAIPFISIFSTGIVAIIALRIGTLVWTRADGLCIALAVLAIVLWGITQEPLTALILSTLADIAVTAPTIIKTYKDPASEPFILWTLYTFACALAILATRDLSVYNLLVPIYTIAVSALIALFARGKLQTKDFAEV